MRQRIFGYTSEEIELIVRPMVEEGKEAIGSMGDDTPLAVLSTRRRLLPDFFRQRFAQVTNPPLDPLREQSVMSLRTLIGRRGRLLDEAAVDARMVACPSPILTERPARRAARATRSAVADAVDHLRRVWRRVRLPIRARSAGARRRRRRGVGRGHPDPLRPRHRRGASAAAGAAGHERGVAGARSRGPRHARRTRDRYRRSARCPPGGVAAGLRRVGDLSVAGLRDRATRRRRAKAGTSASTRQPSIAIAAPCSTAS